MYFTAVVLCVQFYYFFNLQQSPYHVVRLFFLSCRKLLHGLVSKQHDDLNMDWWPLI